MMLNSATARFIFCFEKIMTDLSTWESYSTSKDTSHRSQEEVVPNKEALETEVPQIYLTNHLRKVDGEQPGHLYRPVVSHSTPGTTL